ncbi:beta-glucosidase [Phycisphaerales bacterium]|nr:beta-glucosidase [Phycisphaerales bacterium]
MGFPDGFVWGVAASAYQIEGAAREDGRADSVWDVFCRKPGAVWSGQSGEAACDHYHRYREDVGIIRDIGARAYRLSVSWPRILPQGRGQPNSAGLDFYDRLTDSLLAAGIAPWVTLFHWDYPQALFQRGGWLNRRSADWFAEYADAVVDRLSDRVTNWMTINEPQVFLKFGHADGINAPGLTLSLAEQLQAAHHVLLAHGRAVQAIRARTRSPARVGWAPVCVVKYPTTGEPRDIEAARRATCGVTTRDLWNNTWFNDPVFKGEYPREGLEAFAGAVPDFPSDDFATIRQPMDFLGINIYEGQPVRADAQGRAAAMDRPIGHPLTAFRWPVEPQSLYWGPRFMHERYGSPIYITENGLSNVDWVSLDGKVHDPQRIDFTRRYLLALRRACDDGTDIRGYFHWSLLDNFEWSAGFKERFGLVHVDYATQKRTPKDSARWYRGVIESNGAALDLDPFA